MKTSILQPQWPYDGRIPPDARCYACGRPAECRHHVYGGNPNRQISERNGFWVYLCTWHHTVGPDSVHADMGKNRILKKKCQMKYEEDHDRGDFVKLVGRSYL